MLLIEFTCKKCLLENKRANLALGKTLEVVYMDFIFLLRIKGIAHSLICFINRYAAFSLPAKLCRKSYQG